MYIAGLDVSGPVSGLFTVSIMISRLPWLRPSDEYFRNFGQAFSSLRKSDFNSA